MSRSTLYILFGVLVVCNVTDLLATSYLLTNGFAIEANPVAKWVILHTGFAGLGIIKGIFLAVILVALPAIGASLWGIRLYTLVVVTYAALFVYQLYLLGVH